MSQFKPRTTGRPSGPSSRHRKPGEGRQRHLTDRQRAAKIRLANMSPEERKTHDPNKAPNPRMQKSTPNEVRITAFIVEELSRALRDILKLDGPADVLMSLYFKRANHLGPRERSIIAEAIYYVMRNLSMITWRMDPVKPLQAPRLTALLAISLQHGIDKLEDKTIGREMQPLRNMLGRKPQQAPKYIRAEVPEWLYNKLVVQYSDHNALFDAMKSSATLDLRVNTLKSDRDQVIAELAEHQVTAEKGIYSPDCLRLSVKPALTKWPIYKEGKVEVQDEGSQLIARLMQPKRSEMICDFCAGAGGKTLALGALMKSTGTLYAFDVNEKRLRGLTPRMRRAGLSNIHPAVIRNEHDIRVKRLYGKMDRVLVDAPCSGTGTYRRNPDLKWRFGEEELKRLNEIQKSVIRSAAKMLKSGGRLVYATCSLLHEENQGVIEEFLTENPDFELLNAWDILAHQGVEVLEFQKTRFGNYFVMLPQLNQTDGFFGAVLQKKK
jgi:16S rRNA (cytosine967-C5)-methyltransferase